MTNFDRIKAMSIEEMASKILESIEDCQKCCSITYNGICVSYGVENRCLKGIKQWLESEATENEETVIEKGEYTIVQCSNNHVHIYKDGRMIYHASCNKKMTKNELLDHFGLLEIILDEETEVDG